MKTHLLFSAVALTLLASPLAAQRVQCAPDNGGITLPAGFCASIFADSLAAPRHVWVDDNGDVYVSLSGRGGRGGASAVPGGVILLRDSNRDGRADVNKDVVRGFTTSEVAIFDKHLYTENGNAVFRFPLKDGVAGAVDTIVSGMPGGGNHPRKTFAIGRDGALYVNVGSATNVCDGRGGDPKSPPDPCSEIETRAAIWKYDARKSGQTFASGEHFARGYRNGVGLTMSPDNKLWGVQHGRDALFQNFPQFFDQKYGAENPAEELLQVNKGDDFGWPYCFYSNVEKKLVDAPEYGGDGKKTTRCASKKGPVAAFPGHWAPNDVTFYTGKMFPAKYRNGVFIAFHGSWNRLPEPQGGFRVVYQPLRDGRASGEYETFAQEFNPGNTQPPQGSPNHRPTGVAVGPDGALYISDDVGGRIWKVVYTGR